MPAKKKEEISELRSEGEEERTITITISGELTAGKFDPNAPPPPPVAPPGSSSDKNRKKGAADNAKKEPTPPTSEEGFTPALNAPIIVLPTPTPASVVGVTDGPGVPPPPAPEVYRSDPLSRKTFQLTLFSRKTVVNPMAIASLLIPEWCVTIQTCTATEPRVVDPKAAAKGAAAAKGKGAQAVTEEATDYVDHFVHHFSLQSILVGQGEEVPLKVPGFESLVLSVQCSGPALTPLQVTKYTPAVVNLVEVESMPDGGVLDLRHTMRKAEDPDAFNRIRERFGGVVVKYNFFGNEVITHKAPHAKNVSLKHNRVFFLTLSPTASRLALVQEAFFDPLDVYVSDRTPQGADPEFTGVAHVGLRLATEGNRRVIASEQVLPLRGSLRTPDYVSCATTLQLKILFIGALSKVDFAPVPATPQPVLSAAQSELPAPPQPQRSLSRQTGSSRAITPIPPAPTPPPVSQPPSQQALMNLTITSDMGSAPAPPFLSRLMVWMPYEGTATPAVLRALLSKLMSFKPSDKTSDVVETQRPPSADLMAAPQSPAPVSTKASKGKPELDPAAAALPPPPQYKTLPDGRVVLPVLCSDTVSGFELMDGVQRLIVVEGLFATIKDLADVALAEAKGDPSVRVLFNKALPFPKRFYHEWIPLVSPLNLKEDPPPEPVEEVSPQAKGKEAKGKARATPDKGSRDKQPAVVEPPPPPPEPTGPSRSRKDEMDAGGVGGRIRRIRLAHSLEHLRTKQSHYLRRTLSHDCIECIERLSKLCRTTNMVEAVDHDHFPTSTQLVVLERVAGQTLSTYDVYASDGFYSFSQPNTPRRVAANRKQPASPRGTRFDSKVGVEVKDVDLAAMDGYVGRVASFIGVFPSDLEAKALPSVRTRFRQHPHKCWMVTIDTPTRTPVLCLFRDEIPRQPLKFDVTGQIVRSPSNDDAALYVMTCKATAENGTDARNADFVAKKRRDKKKAPPAMCRKLRKERQEHYNRTHSQAHGHTYRDTSTDDEEGFGNDPPPEVPNELMGVSHFYDATEVETNYVEANRDDLVAKSQAIRQKRLAEAEIASSSEDEGPPVNAQTMRSTMQRTGESLGGTKHTKPFSTVQSRSAAEDCRHPHAPTWSRVEDLKAKWEPMQTAHQSSKGGKQLDTTGGRGVLGDPFKVKSVFSASAAEAYALDRQQRKEAYDAWAAKVVVDNMGKFVPHLAPQRDKPDGTAKYKGMLAGKPQKKTLLMDHVEPMPVSIFEPVKFGRHEKVPTNVSLHPELKKFVYAESRRTKFTPAPLDKSTPLWGKNSSQ